MKAHLIDPSLNESSVMRYYVLPPANHQSSTGRPISPFTIKMPECD